MLLKGKDVVVSVRIEKTGISDAGERRSEITKSGDE
jgi:hypothetical protein